MQNFASRVQKFASRVQKFYFKDIFYVHTVDEIEQKAGIDFFYNLLDDVEHDVEAESNYKSW